MSNFLELENNDAEVQHTTISQRNAIPSVKSSEEEEEEVNPSFLFEADINLVEVPEELENLVGEKTSDNVDVVDVDGTNSKRSLRRSQEYLWIDRVIPYEFTPQITGKRRAERLSNNNKKTIIPKYHSENELERSLHCESGLVQAWVTQNTTSLH